MCKKKKVVKYYNSLLNNHQQESAGSHQKKRPHVQRQNRSPSNCRRGEITLKIEPHTHQRRLECSDKSCVHQDPETPQFNPVQFISVQSLSRVRLLCEPMDYTMPGFPVRHQLLELTQTPVHQVSDVIPPSHPLSSLSPDFNLSQHQDLFQ